MQSGKYRSVIVGALVCGLSTAAFGQAGVPDVQSQMDSLKAEVAQLRAANQEMKGEVTQLRAVNGETWLNERRAEEVKALVKEVLSDADTRASLLENGMTAGHNGSNFFLASEDGTFLLKFAGQLQIRYVANFRNKTETSTIDAGVDGFQVRRAKVSFDGFIGNPKLEYKIQLDIDRDSTVANTQDAWIAYGLMDNLKVFGGRFQDRFGRESYMSSKTQQTAERSAVAIIYGANDGYVEGAGAEWKVLPDWLVLAATVNDGLNSGSSGGTGNTSPFTNGGNDFQNDATDVAFSGRVDVKLAGDWKQMADVESWSTAEGLQLFLGAGGHYEIAETGDSQGKARLAFTSPNGVANSLPYDTFTQWTTDVLAKYQGLSLMAAGYGTYIDTTAAATSGQGTIESYAATVQAGYMVIPDKLEPFARFEWIKVDDALATNELKLVTGGFNYFLKKHAAKFTIDAVWALDNINAANTYGVSLGGAGLLSDAGQKKDQVTLRAQVQLLF